ncbi:MAG: cytochrome c family protein [Phycisphaeraceae bacterium]|nr:cytochrome c family protein [Phycisphaeraceae bacterium]
MTMLWGCCALAWVLGSGAHLASATAGAPDAAVSAARVDASRVVGPDACAECHTNEHAVWMSTAHQSASLALTRDDEAKRIADALGVRRIKTDERCASCHFTMQQEEDKRPKSISGVSCESCHGAGASWIDPHSRFGPGASTAAEETPQHRAERHEYCDSMGMIRPSNLYAMASRCASCHVIADDELVKSAGHPDGLGFEFVSWSQGGMRHNFVREGSDSNPESSPERQRVMFLAGAAAGLESACRSVAGGASTEHVARALGALERIDAAVGIDAVKQLVAIGRGVRDAASAGEAAGKARSIGEAIVRDNTGSGVVGLDELIPAPRAASSEQ